MLLLPTICALLLLGSPAALGQGTPGPIRGRLLDEWGAPLADWEVGAETTNVSIWRQLERRLWSGETKTDAAGRFELDPRPAFLLVARSPDRSLVIVREDFLLDVDEIVLRLRPEDRPSAFVECTLVGPYGELPYPCLWSRPVDREFDVGAERVGERFRLGPLTPGEHLLHASAFEYPDLVFTCFLEPGVTLDLGTIELQRPGWIEIDLHEGAVLRDPDQPVVSRVLREGRHLSGSIFSGALPRTEGMCALGAELLRSVEVGRSAPLAPGRYLLSTRFQGWRAPDRLVDVVADQTVVVALDLEAAVARPTVKQTILVQVSQRDPSTRLTLRVTGSDGTLVYEQTNTYRHPRAQNFVFDVEGLARGRYRVETRSAAGLRAEADFEIHTESRAPADLVLHVD